MAVRVVCYKNIFSNAGVIHDLPEGMSIDAVRKELGLSRISRVLCDGKPCTTGIITAGHTFELYETVANDSPAAQMFDKAGDVVDRIGDAAKHVGNETLELIFDSGAESNAAWEIPFRIIGNAASGLASSVADCLVPSTPAGGDGDNKQRETLTSRPDISGAKNQSATGGTVPVILGRRLITPQAIGTYWTEPAGTDGEDIYVHGLLVVGYGPLLIERIKLGDYDLGITTTEANCRNVVLIANKNTSTWLADDDECILHIVQENAPLDARTYGSKVVEEAVNLELVWPNNVQEVDYIASAPPRMTAAGAVRVDATISAKGFVQYNGNYEEDLEGVTFKMLYRIPDTLDWQEFTTQTVKAVPTGRFLKEIRYVVSGTFPTNLTGPHTRFEVTIVRSRANKVDASPDSNYSYLDSWQWDTLRTITNVAPISASMCSKVCRIGFRIKATERLSGNLDAINLMATSILPTLEHSIQGSRWRLDATDAWHATTNPADFYVAAFLDIWCNTEDIAVDGSTLTGRAKLKYWQDNDLGLDWDALADYHLWCDEAADVQLTDASVVHLVHQCEVNTLINTQMKLQELLQAVLSVGRASFVYKNGKYSLVHDARYGSYSDLANYHNPANGMIRQALITPRDAEFSFSRQFSEDYDEAIIEFVTAASNQYQQVSVTIRNPYVSNAIYNAHRAAGKLRVYKANTKYITNVYQIQLWITYQFAIQALRKLTASVKVGPAQYGYALGSRITIAHDMLLQGFGSARISNVATVGIHLHITMDDVLYGDALSWGIQKALVAYIWILDPATATQRAVVMDCSMVDYTAHDASIASFAKIAIHMQAFSDASIDTDSIIRGLRIAVGVKGVTAEDFILVGKTVDAQHGAQLTLMQAADNVHLIDQRTYAPYNYATSPTQTAIAAQVTAAKPPVRTISANLAQIQSIAQSIDTVQHGDPGVPPAPISMLTAIAYQDYIEVRITWDEYGLNNTLSGFEIDIFNGTEWITELSTSPIYVYVFDRSMGVYPEKTVDRAGAKALNTWRVRARAVNIYNQTSIVYGPSTAGVSLDLSKYRTWIPSAQPAAQFVAEESGIRYTIPEDTQCYNAAALKYIIALNGTQRIITSERSGLIPFDRQVDGYPETEATRTAENITGGTALDDFSIQVSAQHTEVGITPYSICTATPDVSQYKRWIPVAPVLTYVRAVERGIEYLFAIDEDAFYGTAKKYDIQVNGTARIVGTYSKEGIFVFNRATDGYPETKAERTAHGISTGTAIDDYVLIVRAYTTEKPVGKLGTGKKPAITAYKTWIPHLPSIAVAAAGRNITLRFTPGNDCYGSINYLFQVQKSTDGSNFYAVGDNAQAWADETAYRSGAAGGYSATPLETYVQVVPLTNQSADLPEDTTYNYKAAAVQTVLEASGGLYITAYTAIATAIARATATKDIVSKAVKTAQLDSYAVIQEKLAIADFANLATASELYAASVQGISSTAISGYGTTDACLIKAVSTGEYLMLSAKAPGKLRAGDVIDVSLTVKAETAGLISVYLWLYDAAGLYLTVTGFAPSVTTTFAQYTGVITVPAQAVSACYILVGIADSVTTKRQIYVKNPIFKVRVSSNLIADGALELAKFAAGLRPPRVVTSLPDSPYTGWAAGDQAYLTTDNKIYRFTGSGFTKDVDGGDVVAGTITAGAIQAGAIGVTQLASGSGVNLVPYDKSSFENYDAGYVLPWLKSAAVALVIASDKALDGYKSLKLMTASTSDGYVYMGADVSYDVKVEAGKRYIVSVYLYSATAVQYDLFVRRNTDGEHTGIIIAGSLPAGVWTRVFAPYTPAAGVTGLMLRVDLDTANSSMYVDAWQVEEAHGAATQPSPYRTPGLTTIEGGLIKTGTMNADRIETGTITTGLMTANTINGDRILAGTLNANKIEARTISTEQLRVTARSKINTLQDVADGTTGWTLTGLATAIVSYNGVRALRITAGSGATIPKVAEFSIEPTDIVQFSCGLICPNYVSGGGFYVSATLQSFTENNCKVYVWDELAKAWGSASLTGNAYLISKYNSTFRTNFRTYILGSLANISDIPAPTTASGIYVACMQLLEGNNLVQLRMGYTAVTEGTYWDLIAPEAHVIGSSKIVAEQIEVTSLAAVNSRLGQVQGDDADNYKLVLGQGFTDPEGTFLLGSVNDAAYFRRYQSGGNWYLDIKTSSFIVTSVSSTVIGTFYTKATAAGDAVFTITPTVSISTTLPLWVDGRITAISSTGNDYNQLAIEVRGNGNANTVYPGIGFHQPGKYSGALLLSAAGDFKFYNQGLGSYAGLCVGNLTATGDITVTGNISAAGLTIRRLFTLNLSALPTTTFYPVTFGVGHQLLDCEIISPGGSGSLPYNQNAMRFQLRAMGWSDTPVQLEVLSGRYSSSEVTIGAIMRGAQGGDRAVYLRGGFVYSVLSNYTPTLRTTTYTFGNEQYVPGTAYTGGSNVNVDALWTASEALGASVKTIYGELNVLGIIQSRNSIKVNNANGNLQLGALNADYCHFVTDRPSFYFDHALIVNGDIGRYVYTHATYASRQVGTLHGYNIQRHTHSSGYLIGSYNSVGTNDAKTNPIYTIGSAYMPTDTSLGTMYGIGFSHSNFWGTGKSNGWGLYVAENGIVKATIASAGIWTAGALIVAGAVTVGGALSTAMLLTSAIQAGYSGSNGVFVPTTLTLNSQGGDVSIGSASSYIGIGGSNAYIYMGGTDATVNIGGTTSLVYIRGALVAPKKYLKFTAGTRNTTIVGELLPLLKNNGQHVTCIGNYGLSGYPAIISRDGSTTIRIYNTANDQIYAASINDGGAITSELQLEFIIP